MILQFTQMWGFLKVKGVTVSKRFKTSPPSPEKPRPGKVKGLVQSSCQRISRCQLSHQPPAPSGQQLPLRVRGWGLGPEGAECLYTMADSLHPWPHDARTRLHHTGRAQARVPSWRTDYGFPNLGAPGHCKSSCAVPTFPFDPKEGKRVESKEKSPVGRHQFAQSKGNIKAAPVSMETRWAKQGNKTERETQTVTTFWASVIHVVGPEP